MKFVVYFDEKEMFITTPDKEGAMMAKHFGNVIRPYPGNFKRVEMEADYLVAANYNGEYGEDPILRLGVEGSGSRDLHLSYKPSSTVG